MPNEGSGGTGMGVEGGVCALFLVLQMKKYHVFFQLFSSLLLPKNITQLYHYCSDETLI